MGRIALMLVAGVAVAAAAARADVTERIDVAADGSELAAGVAGPALAMTPDARFVAFVAQGALGAGVARGTHVWVRDRSTGLTSIADVDSDGAVADGTPGSDLGGLALSADGRFVAFTSAATNLVATDANVCGASTVVGACPDAFLHDRLTAATLLVSVATGGTQGNAATTGPVALSANGHVVAFISSATNLVADDTNAKPDVFVRDLDAGTTRRVSIRTGGGQGHGTPTGTLALSADGRYVLFGYTGDDLAPGAGSGSLYLYDRVLATTVHVGDGSAGFALSADATHVAFASVDPTLVPGDTNGLPDVFLRTLATGATVRVDVASDGSQALGGSPTFAPIVALSADGRFAAFTSDATNLVAGDTNGVPDVFVHDAASGTTVRVDVASDGTQAAAGSPSAVAVSADGTCAAFVSDAPNLVPCDTNGRADVFVHCAGGTPPPPPAACPAGPPTFASLSAELGTLAALLAAQVPPGRLATALGRIVRHAAAAVAAADQAQAKPRRVRAALTAALQALSAARARLATRRAARLVGAAVRTQLVAAVDQARADAKLLRAAFTGAGSGA
jgi:Tol biopolymer transport system component